MNIIIYAFINTFYMTASVFKCLLYNVVKTKTFKLLTTYSFS